MLGWWWTSVVAAAPSPGVEPLAADAVVAVQAVELDAPWRYTWMDEPRAVSRGVLVIVRVDPDLARPRQTLNPVLFVGAEPVEVLRRTADAACLVGLVPRPTAEGERLFWAPAERLPEQIDAAWGRDQLAAAVRRGVSVVPAAQGTVHVPDHRAFDGVLDAALARCR